MTEQESIAIELIARHTGHPAPDITPAKSLDDLGVDSLQFMVILLELQKALGRDVLTVENVGNIRTVEDILSLVRRP